jgi:hypothetical protein
VLTPGDNFLGAFPNVAPIRGPPVMTEYQFAGDDEAHGIPSK